MLFVFSTNGDQSPLIKLGLDIRVHREKDKNLVAEKRFKTQIKSWVKKPEERKGGVSTNWKRSSLWPSGGGDDNYDDDDDGGGGGDDDDDADDAGVDRLGVVG